MRLYKDQRCEKDNVQWAAADEPLTPWQAEWNVLIDAIRNDRPHNEARRAALSNLADIMGRAAVHTGQLVTWEQAMASNFQWFPEIDQLDENGASPISAGDAGATPSPCRDCGPSCNARVLSNQESGLGILPAMRRQHVRRGRESCATPRTQPGILRLDTTLGRIALGQANCRSVRRP